MRLSATLFVLAVLVAGCAPTYRPSGINGGYGETRLDTNVFRVNYQGDIHQKQSDTDEMALLRSAEVAEQNGFAYFTSSGAAATGSAVSLATNVVSIPATTMTIVCYVTRPDTTGLVYEAAQVIATLGPKYRKL
jgi:hypothetical protein